MDNTQLVQFILSTITSNAVVILIIQKLKSSKAFPWISSETKRLNTLLAYLGSLLAAVGVHASYDHATGTLVITGLTMMGILHGLWTWLQSYATQELMYQGFFNKPVTPSTTVTVDSKPAVSVETVGTVAPKT